MFPTLTFVLEYATVIVTVIFVGYVAYTIPEEKDEKISDSSSDGSEEPEESQKDTSTEEFDLDESINDDKADLQRLYDVPD
uniref:Cbb3-type cytochrome oxidase assembly protein CcoS n=1 Tax=Bursaphelenchus xylophilus TaxID=6326 RepID=A0A1I7SJP0_BURXY